ncbi:MAG: serine hydrolase [Chloroflexota bacterium]|nr:serine hydrolase [Chloroflexota bacterium]
MRNLLLLLLVILVAVAVLLGPSALAYYNSQGPLPGGISLAGLDPSGQDLEEIAGNLHETFMQPVAVYYDGERIILYPEDIGFQPDVNAMIAEAVPFGEGLGFWRPFPSQLMDHPPDPLDIPLKYTLDEEKLGAWFYEVAQDFDQEPRPPSGVALVPGTPYTSTFMFQAGKPGLELEPNLSMPGLLDALEDPVQREAHLVLVEIPPPPPTIKELERLLANRADQFPGLVSIFVRQVGGDEEVSVDPDIAFAGMSTMKVPIMAELYRSVLGKGPGVETTKLLTSTMGLSGNFTANLLLRLIGGGNIGDEWSGADRVTATLRNLGLENSFMATPYDKDSLPKTYSTPANSRTDVSTAPDKHMQTTAKDSALLLEWLVQCSEGGGTLLAIYPDQLTADECSQMLEFMDLNKKDILLETGLPPDVRMVHKHGFVEDSHSDAAIVWSPAGPYVVAVFIHKFGWVEWDLSSSIMADVSKAAWDYFTLVANGGEPPKVESSPEEETVEPVEFPAAPETS